MLHPINKNQYSKMNFNQPTIIIINNIELFNRIENFNNCEIAVINVCPVKRKVLKKIKFVGLKISFIV